MDDNQSSIFNFWVTVLNRKVLKGLKGNAKKQRDNYRAKNNFREPFAYFEYFAVQSFHVFILKLSGDQGIFRLP